MFAKRSSITAQSPAEDFVFFRTTKIEHGNLKQEWDERFAKAEAGPTWLISNTYYILTSKCVMGDRNHHRDRTLVLRILVPTLETAIRDKMVAAEIQNSSPQTSSGRPEEASTPAAAASASHSSKGTIVDLDGVSIEPASLHSNASHNSNSNNDRGSSDPTLWKFQCDGAVYPARLVNLPCPVELHKTHDHAMYYKSVDIAQMLIVYEDMQALEEAESAPGYSVDEFASYYHSGLTPPMHKVVQRRFAAREHKAVAPPSMEISQVEKEIVALIELLSTKDSTKKMKSTMQSPPTNRASIHGTHIVQEEMEDDIVDYEPWMDNYGKTPGGIEFDERDEICKKHPELWLTPQQYTQLLDRIHGKSSTRVTISSGPGTSLSGAGISSTSSTTTTKIKTHKTHGNTVSSINTTTGSSLLDTSTEAKKPKKKKRKDSLVDSTAPSSTTTTTLAPNLGGIHITKDPDAYDELLRMDETNMYDLIEDLFEVDVPL